MKFRKLYWVTEQVGKDGTSEIAGVYTSIPDLVERGLLWREGIERRESFRLTLVSLDSKKKPLGTWTLPDFGTIEQDLGAYVSSQEFSMTEVESLVESLKGFHASV
jgi:hypothetical protein